MRLEIIFDIVTTNSW